MKTTRRSLLVLLVVFGIAQVAFQSTAAHMSGGAPVVQTTAGQTKVYWTAGHENRRTSDTICGGKFTMTIGNRIARDSTVELDFQRTYVYAYDLEDLNPEAGPGWIYNNDESTAFDWWGVPPTSAPWGIVAGTISTSSIAYMDDTAVTEFMVRGGNSNWGVCVNMEQVGYLT